MDVINWLQGFAPDVKIGRIELIVLIVVLTALSDFLVRQVLGKLSGKAAQTSNAWDDALLTSIRGPLVLIVWVLGVGLALTVAQIDVPPSLRDWVGSARDLGIIATVAWFLQRWISEAGATLKRERRLGTRELDLATIQAVSKVSSLAVWVITLITGLETLGFDLTAILTVGGIGGIAVGFASRDVVANFFGGMMIYAMQPFRAGDWIRSPDRNIEGTVEEVGWYQTRIRTFDKRPLYVPNAIFPEIALENPSRMLHRRIYETIGVRYDDFAKLKPIIEDVRRMLEEHPDIQTEGVMLMVNFNAYAASSLDFFVYTFTKTRDWATYHSVKQDVLLRIGEIIEKHGAQIAFPTRTLHVPEGVRLAGEPRPEPLP